MLGPILKEVKDSLGIAFPSLNDVDKTSKFQVNIKSVVPYNDFVSKRKTVMETIRCITRKKSLKLFWKKSNK
jgi:hypothetical protein